MRKPLCSLLSTPWLWGAKGIALSCIYGVGCLHPTPLPLPLAVGFGSCKLSGWMGSPSLSRPTGATSDPVTKAVNSVHYVCLFGVTDGSIKFNEAMPSLITIVNQL